MDFASLFHRDLSRLMKQLEAFPSREMIWAVVPGITNSAGTLALHLEGNLREYIGRQLGGEAYARNRVAEFSPAQLETEEIIARLEQLRTLIPHTLEGISDERMKATYPEVVLGVPLSVEDFIAHLYGHLNWHLGQIDSLRRALTGDGAIPAVGLNPRAER
ncbi:MAG: DinB family protein [Gemmatimonadaceae bacterium]|nr:DinB family protein [Gemmatimonadaceae bacterium]